MCRTLSSSTGAGRGEVVLLFARVTRLVLPVQDGTLGYGGGLGLSEVTRLDARGG